jgi:hypothetical protein
VGVRAAVVQHRADRRRAVGEGIVTVLYGGNRDGAQAVVGGRGGLGAVVRQATGGDAEDAAGTIWCASGVVVCASVVAACETGVVI